jgi:TolB-like protein/Flp pilus assembly protein TadD
MTGRLFLFAELKRRNVLRAAVLYAGAVWALAQGIAQLGPFFAAPEWTVRWFVIAAIIGFPFWIAFAWFYEFTPQGLKRESEIAPDDSTAHGTGKKLNFAIIGVLTLAVVLLLTNTFVWHEGAGLASQSTNNAAVFARIPGKSVAVLPLVNESGAKDQQYFSDGLSEDLITALSQFAGLKVINRDSSFQFRDSKDSVQLIGEQLGVAHLLEGSVQKLGDEVRISAELVNCADGSTLWSEHYDRPYKDLFALQDGITKAVADALKAKLLTMPGAVAQSDRPPSGNLAAYTAYLRGVADEALETEAGQRNAIAQFDEAIRLDPRYALAYAATSQAWGNLASTFATEAAEQQHDIAQARTAVDRALQLNPDLAAAHEALAGLMIAFDFNWQGALSESRRAAELAPGSPDAKSGLAATQARLGHLTTAVELDRQALASAPLSANGYFGLGRKLSGLGQLDQAETALRKSIELAPGASRPYAYLAIIEVQRRDAAAALAAAQKTPSGYWHDFAVALALQIGTNRMASEAALKNFIEKYSGTAAYQIAEVYALRRDPDNLFKWLDRAWSNDDAGVELLLFDPLMLRYKDDPRFTAFCKKVGLPTTTDAKA